MIRGMIFILTLLLLFLSVMEEMNTHLREAIKCSGWNSFTVIKDFGNLADGA